MKHLRQSIAILSFGLAGLLGNAGAGICDPNPCVDGPEMLEHKQRELDAKSQRPLVEVLTAQQLEQMQGRISSILASEGWVVVPGGSWLPTRTQMDMLRSRLKLFVERSAATQRVALAAWAEYKFQIQGQNWGDGKVIYVNAFCISSPDYASQRFVKVLDGGPCFFRLYFDPRLKTFHELAFNGVG